MTQLTHDEIVTRERGLYDACIEQSRDPVFAIAQDRKVRYDAYLSELVVRPDVAVWSSQMEVLHGPVCRYYNSTVGYIVALLVCRYGEAEYYWPDPSAGFTDEDVARANEWLRRGDIPSGCYYL